MNGKPAQDPVAPVSDIYSHQLDRGEQAIAALYPWRMMSYGAVAANLALLLLTPVILIVIGNVLGGLAVFVFIYAESAYLAIGVVLGFLLAGAIILLNRTACFLFAIAFFAYLPVQIFFLARSVLRHSELGSALVSSVASGILVWLTFSLAAVLLRLARLSAHDRALLRAPFDGMLNKAACEFCCGLPPIVKFVPGAKARLLIFASSVFFALSFTRVGDLVEITNRETVSRQLGLLALELAAIPLLIAVANWLLRCGHKSIRFSIEQITVADPRSPLLFLRAFRDDQVTLSAPHHTLLGRLFAVAMAAESLDSMLLTEGTLYGPIVALGNPRDSMPPYGAARGYVANEHWQDAVTQLARSSLAIVICVDDTDSIWWEIEHLVGHDHLNKTVFLMHPSFRSQADNRRITSRILTTLAIPTRLNERISDAFQTADVIGFFFDKGGNLCIGKSRWFTSSSYLLMTRWFLRHKFGYGVESRTPARSYPGASRNSSSAFMIGRPWPPECEGARRRERYARFREEP